jgi:mannosyltransferase OCH1-like enzyme
MNELELYSLAEAVRISDMKVVLHTDAQIDISGVEVRLVEFPTHHNGKPIKHIEHSVDMKRFEVAQEEGGFYSDTDIVLFKPLTELLRYEKNVFAFQNKAYKTICIGFFGCSINNDIITRARKAYLDGYPGKSYHALASFKKLVPDILDLVVGHNELVILPQREFFPVRMRDPTFYTEENDETNRKWGYGCHLWMHVINRDCISLVISKLKKR